MCREQDKPVFQRIEGGLDIRHGHPGVHPYLMGEITIRSIDFVTIEIPRGHNGGAVGIPWEYPLLPGGASSSRWGR